MLIQNDLRILSLFAVDFVKLPLVFMWGSFCQVTSTISLPCSQDKKRKINISLKFKQAMPKQVHR